MIAPALAADRILQPNELGKPLERPKTGTDLLADYERLIESQHSPYSMARPVADARNVTWTQLRRLHQSDPEESYERWEAIREEARAELRSGECAAKVFETRVSQPWRRSQFLAVREALSEDLHPRNGTERIMIDAMAQSHFAFQFWLERSILYATFDCSTDSEAAKETGSLSTPRVTDFQSVDQAVAMADRFNKMFVRSLRALIDMRRHAPVVIVQSAEQVNVGETCALNRKHGIS